MTVSAAEAERQVRSSRGELDRTMEALRDKMTPGELFREAKRATGNAGDQLVAKLIDQAKENPMPFAVMGLGLAWLASSSRDRHERRGFEERRSFAPSEPGMIDKAQDAVGGAAGSLNDKAHSAAGQVGDAFARASDSLRDTASAAMDQVQATRARVNSMNANASRSAQDLGQRATDTVSDLFDREPLLIGVLGLFVGLAVGASLPATETEKRALAPMASKVSGAAKAAAQDTLDQVSETTQAVYGSVKDELKKGDGSQSPTETIERAAHAGAQAARSQTGG